MNWTVITQSILQLCWKPIHKAYCSLAGNPYPKHTAVLPGGWLLDTLPCRYHLIKNQPGCMKSSCYDKFINHRLLHLYVCLWWIESNILEETENVSICKEIYDSRLQHQFLHLQVFITMTDNKSMIEVIGIGKRVSAVGTSSKCDQNEQRG